MTAPDPTAPTAEDVIARALWTALNVVAPMRHIFGDEVADSVEVLLAQEVEHASPAVVAAIRAMTVEQLAELIGGEVQRSGRVRLSDDGLFEHEPVARVVGPWQETP